ncbi:Uncharacterized protein Rs2_09350 [Raphanus sativus]|nr:Uncharacterized protein Rs2_09350 [Raphanus sativus]
MSLLPLILSLSLSLTTSPSPPLNFFSPTTNTHPFFTISIFSGSFPPPHRHDSSPFSSSAVSAPSTTLNSAPEFPQSVLSHSAPLRQLSLLLFCRLKPPLLPLLRPTPPPNSSPASDPPPRRRAPYASPPDSAPDPPPPPPPDPPPPPPPIRRPAPPRRRFPSRVLSFLCSSLHSKLIVKRI